MKTIRMVIAVLLLLTWPFWPFAKFVEITIGFKTNRKDGAGMLLVPAGEFLMGSDDHEEDEKPAHQVVLDDFWIYKTAVTVKQYKRFCKATGYQMPEEPDWGWIDSHPVVNVSWDDAQAYCAWAGVKLPTEAQWEKAARGTDGRIYPWGNESKSCTGKQMNAARTVPVGRFLQFGSPFGVQDMTGNIWEWCADWYGEDYYRNSPGHNPKGPPGGERRILRGGGWYRDSSFCRSSFRDKYIPSVHFSDIGFRCVSSRR